jgi:hypothetical protein
MHSWLSQNRRPIHAELYCKLQESDDMFYTDINELAIDDVNSKKYFQILVFLRKCWAH